MTTADDINKIKDEEFKNLLLEFNRRVNFLNRKFSKISFDDTTDDGLFIKYELAKFLLKKIETDELVNAFNISDKTKYKKQMEIVKNLISYTKDRDYFDSFSSLIWTPESDNYFDSVLKFLKSQNITFRDNLDDKINNFLRNDLNWKAHNYGKSKYYSEDEEIYKLRCTLANELGLVNMPDDFQEFIDDCQLENPRECFGKDTIFFRNKYKYKRLGNIGEHFVYDWLENLKTNPIWVARDLGDGFGYDEYCADTRERIVESKATFRDRDSENDEFKLSEDEHAVMCDCIDTPDREYYLFRTYIDSSNISYDNRKGLVLIPRDENTLVSTYKDFPCTYNFDRVEDGKKVFVKKKNES